MTQPDKTYTVTLSDGQFGSVWRESAESPGQALDAAAAKLAHNNPEAVVRISSVVLEDQ